ncbi:MAG: chromosomal replication initiator protein DnaA [Phycisphaeraceae bacterium]|nr:chromosomal replication initiator protein DnaA [Phycisphaeraceae bacterium]
MGRPDPNLLDGMLTYLRRTHPAMCRRWFADIEPLDQSGGVLRLLVRESVQLRYLQRQCSQQFSEAAQAVTGSLLAVRFVGESEVSASREDLPAGVRAAELQGAEKTGAFVRRSTSTSSADLYEMVLSPDYLFSNFITGPDNRLAHAGAVAVARKPGRAYNPFFIHSGFGLGKTHLLHAICHALLEEHPDFRIYYTSCEGFMTQFHEAVSEGDMTGFRYRFRHVDMLVIDDIHDLSKRERTQEEFFHTFNCLSQAGKQIVLSSDAPPNEIPDLEERLVSRFSCGLVVPIDRPCYETRVEIVKNKALMRGFEFPVDVAEYIAARIDSNIRELEGAISRVQSVAAAEGAPFTLELAKRAIGEPRSSGAGHPTIHRIIEIITGYYNVKPTDLLSKRRHKSIALPRQVGMWLARRHTRYSLEEIGGYFGGRDHTTVMHAIRTVDSKRQVDQILDHDVARIEELVLTPGS